MAEDKPEKDPRDPFLIKIPDLPQVGSADATRTEQELLANLKAKGPRGETLKPLAIFYSRVGQQEKAYQYLKVWMKYTRNKAELAECLLMSGQLAEQIQQPASAVAFYREGLKHGTDDPKVAYYLHNNLAYCLNQTAEYEEASRHCEAAIALDGSRANAYKNLGVTQQALGRLGDAARSWIKALHVDASDDRSLELLEQLVANQREAVIAALPDIDAQLEACRRATAAAKNGRFADWARGLTMN